MASKFLMDQAIANANNYGLQLGTPFNNLVGGVDQYAREMEALEAARGGQEVSVNELGGTLQDFYTNRNPGTDANTRFEVIDDNINFNNAAVEAPNFMWMSPQFKDGLDNSMYGGDRRLVGSDGSVNYYTGDKFPEGHVDYPSQADGITNYEFDKQPQGIVNVDQVKNLIANAQRNDFKNFYGNQDQWQGFVDRGDPLPIEPQYRISDQLNRDFLQGGIFKDGIKSLSKSKNKFLEDVSGLKNMIGSGFNKAKEGIMGSSAMDFLRGLPTPGNLIMSIASGRNPLNPKSPNYNPTLQGQIDYMKDKGMYGITDQSGLNKITGGRLAGKNLVSMFGSNDLGEMFSKDLAKLEGYLSTMPQRFSKLRKNNPASYEKKVENLQNKIKQNKIEAQAAQAAREAATAARAMARNPEVYRNAGITSGGFASQNTGTNENFSNKTGRGRTGYSDGGLASLFTRRG